MSPPCWKWVSIIAHAMMHSLHHVYLVRCHLSLNTYISTQSYRNMGQLVLQKLLTRLVRNQQQEQVAPAWVWSSNQEGPPKPNQFMSPQHEGPAELLQNHLHFSTHHILYLLWGKKRASNIRKVTENRAAAWFARLDGTKWNTWCCGVWSEHWARLIETRKKKRNKPPNNWIFSNQTDNIYSLRVVPKYFRKFLSLSE